MIDFEENIIIIWILDKSRSVAPDKLEINLVSPYSLYHITQYFQWKCSNFRVLVISLCARMQEFITKIFQKNSEIRNGT